MSLLIKGLDMLKLDENEERLWVPGWIEVGKDGKAIFCTGTHFDPNTIHSYAVEEVPTPHGRLIDADKAATSISMMNNHPCGNSIETVNDVVEWLRFADENGNNIAFPTIIEAEVSE